IYLQYLLKQMYIPADFFLCMHKRHLSLADLRRQKTDWANESANADNAEDADKRQLRHSGDMPFAVYLRKSALSARNIGVPSL
ncbi:hypothetical protein, partial [Prevotella sp.]|uniref:hypothetical protein n=1 Tax=Prevotella sp. TaxID=59823 RepID=UPI0026480A41